MIACPKCGAKHWFAIETGSWFERVDLLSEDGQIVIEPDPMGSFVQEHVSSVTVAYTCANEECDFSIEAAEVEQLGRA